MSTTLPIQEITRDWQCQPRAYLTPAVIDQYAEAMTEGATFPPVVVFREGETHWLVDGFHRVAAAEQTGRNDVNCEIREGTFRDAVLYSVGANATHGLQRTSHDKREAVDRLLEDPEWSQWSDREIARRCNVSHTFVQNYKKSLATVASEREAAIVKYPDRWGNESTMNITNIGTSSRPSTPVVEEVRIEFTELAKAFPPKTKLNITSISDTLDPRSTSVPTLDLGPDVDDWEEVEDLPASTPEQCQSAATALEALLVALHRPDGDHVMLTEVIEHLAAHANADDQQWMLAELDNLYTNIMYARGARASTLAALRAKAS